MDTIVIHHTDKGATQLPYLLSNIKETFTQHGEHYITGNLKNLYFKIKGEQIRISGSLCKYYHGNNINNMSLIDTKNAIIELQETIGINLDNAKVTRLDFAGNLLMDYSINKYLSLLDYSPRYERLEQPNCIYFKNTLRTITIYDKLKELRTKRIPFHKIWDTANILRAEVRFEKNLKTKFKKEVTVKDLYCPFFFAKLVFEWRKELLNIKLKQSPPIAPANMTAKQFKDFLLSCYINEKGKNSFNKIITDNKSNFNNKQEIKRARAFLNKTTTKTEPSKLEKELRQSFIQTRLI